MKIEVKQKKQLFTKLSKLVFAGFDSKKATLIDAFIHEYYSEVALQDLLERTAEDLVGSAVAHWQLAQTHKKGFKVKVYNPETNTDGWASDFSVIEIVAADRPYLINSLTMNLNQRGLTCHFVVHPIIDVCRDKSGALTQPKPKAKVTKEAFIRLEIDRQGLESNELALIQAEVHKVLQHCEAVNEDWSYSLEKLSQAASALIDYPCKDEGQDLAEAAEFLQWIAQDNFIFLGCREYELVKTKKLDGFKILAGSGRGILRDELATIPTIDVIPITNKTCDFMSEPCPLIVTKATTKSIVQRAAYMDYIGVKKFDKNGQVIGEYRFLGLYTSKGYKLPINQVPLIRKKVQKVFKNSRYKLDSYSGRALMNTLESLPRDELFHANDEELLALALGVLQLRERQRIRLFARCDGYGQFVSILVYVPRDRYNTHVRKKMSAVICEMLKADNIDFNIEFSESMFARVHFTVHTPEHWSGEFNVVDLENEIIDALRDWKDDLSSTLNAQYGTEKGVLLFNRYGEGFASAYKEKYSVDFAILDIEKAEALRDKADQSIQMSLYKPEQSVNKGLQFKLINKGAPAPLSQTLPVLENMGVTVYDEHPFEIKDSQSNISYWVHDFGLIYNATLPNFQQLKDKFQTVFEKVWTQHVENDGFNRLVIKANLDWKKIMLLRAYYLYLRQAGIAFSQAYVEQTLESNPTIASHLVHLFELKFEPLVKNRAKKIAQHEALIAAEIETVVSLDEDRILRRYLNLIQSTLRTSYYQVGEDAKGIPYVAFKLDPIALMELPSPRPKFEIFVYSPRIEGVHLRGGDVARGGLRWSDRKEDFRTEVLGLMKAQMSKNAVIVPTGAKGGFIVKRSLDGLPRDEVMTEVIECYSIFIGALLDITDNLKGEQVVPPSNVVRYDNDDPYLVVAADKGTATFSDIANGIAIAHGFWLGDAFASGGSVGYDHKKMGITAKGAWESVKRHFREMGVDTQTTAFNVIGIGDMGGDVFGNGMLLSEKIRLQGAFNHLHIFLDPTPDTAASFKERQRLFNLPRSSWADYETKLISNGGGIYSRAEKSITLSLEVQKMLDISTKTLTPNELIQAMLKAPVDLLWNGGIGTYVKSSKETNDQVGDRANDSLRVNGKDLRCKVIGEGGNLGFTQLGRIEYAANGRVNTDAIDNAAGVDCSDHEVNIKILLNKLVEQASLSGKQRDNLLAKMTDEVSDLVLRNNYLQTQAISMVERQAPAMLEVHARLIDRLGQEGRLDRLVEYLPDHEEIEQRKTRGEGLYRPELAVVFAYSKLLLKDLFSGAEVLKDAGFKDELTAYFPSQLRRKHAIAINDHRLRDDIIVNQLVNSMVNRLGPSFAFRMRDEVGASIGDVIKHYKIACEIFNAQSMWREIEALDNQLAPEVQVELLMEVRKLIERTMFWLQSNRAGTASIDDVIQEFGGQVALISREIVDHATADEKAVVENRSAGYQSAGVGEPLAQKISSLELEFTCLDIIAVQSVVKQAKADVPQVYFSIRDELKLSWLHSSISQLPRKNYWQSLARSALRDDLHAESRALLVSIFQGSAKKASVQARVKAWCESNRVEIERYLHLLNVIQTENETEIEQLSVILKELHALVEKSKIN